MEKFGEIEYHFDSDKNGVTHNMQIFWKGNDIREAIRSRMDATRPVITDPFDRTAKTLEFDLEIETICSDVFPALVHIGQQDPYASAAMASHLFEQFTVYWKYELLATGKDLLGIRVWEKVLELTYKWENNNNAKIHKGTPYFFLAENYLLLGDRDLAFTSLLNGFHEDSVLGDKTPVGNYPWESPGYFVAIMSDQRNQMGPLMRRLRSYLDQFIINFRNEFSSIFTIQDFDQKFLHDQSLSDIVLFFHYNFFYIYDLHMSLGQTVLQDNFSKLRGLDVFLNLTLIIDEVLKHVYKKYNMVS